MYKMGKLKNRIPALLIYKEGRYMKHFPQKEIAEGTGLTDSAISRIMRYKTLDNVPFLSMVKIAEWLEVSPLELFEVSAEEIDDEE
jgi:transcriptional regulator with XRE-family HTH domain